MKISVTYIYLNLQE